VCVYYFLITLGVCMHVYCDLFSYVLLGLSPRWDYFGLSPKGLLCVCVFREREREIKRGESGWRKRV
jgi:hypothetical protein